MFRVSLVEGLSHWEHLNPSLSLALRVLRYFLIYHMAGVTDRFAFANFGNFVMDYYPPAELRLSHVLKVISAAKRHGVKIY